MSDSSLCRLTVETKLGSYSAVRVAILTRNLTSCVMRSHAQNVIPVGRQGNGAPSLRNSLNRGAAGGQGLGHRGAAAPCPLSGFAHGQQCTVRQYHSDLSDQSALEIRVRFRVRLRVALF